MAFLPYPQGGALVSSAPTKQTAFICLIGALETSAPPENSIRLIRLFTQRTHRIRLISLIRC